jgi:REP element-mobilizing transposase RayT
MPDHCHLLVGIKPSISISDLARDIKAISSKFINESHWIKGKLNWQEGFGSFSYSKSQINSVCSYILNQEEHHQKKSFKNEYLELLKEFEAEYEEKYLFEWMED